VWLAQRAAHVSMIDLMVYRAEGWTVRGGGDLYAMRATDARLPTTYPPFAALLFAPLSRLPSGVIRAGATAANLGLVPALAALSLRLVGRRNPTAVFAVAAVAVWCEPVWTTLGNGQVNLLLVVLVLWDLTRPPAHRWAGVGIGLAAGIKLTPALFAVLLALAGLLSRRARSKAAGHRPFARRPGTRDTGRPPYARRHRTGAAGHPPYARRALTAATTFTATAALAAAALPYDSRRYWTSVVFTPDRVGFGEDTANQSLRGVAARLEHTGDPGTLWVLAALVVGCAGLAVAVGALLAGDRLPNGAAWAAVACAITALLVSPVSWSHHWVWAVPMVVLLGAEAVRRRSGRWACGAAAAGLPFCAYLPWQVPHGASRPELRQGAAEMVLSAGYPLAGLAFLTVTGRLAYRALRRPPAGQSPNTTAPARTFVSRN
jgi:hypothetical protein